MSYTSCVGCVDSRLTIRLFDKLVTDAILHLSGFIFSPVSSDTLSVFSKSLHYLGSETVSPVL